MRSETLVYIRDLAHGLADLAEKNDLGLIARLYRMAEIETKQLDAVSGVSRQAAAGSVSSLRPLA